jgi:hypothetical protein
MCGIAHRRRVTTSTPRTANGKREAEGGTTMIDRTELDLRLAAHTTTTTRINAQEWQRQGRTAARPIRLTLAAALVALASRIAPPASASTPAAARLSVW